MECRASRACCFFWGGTIESIRRMDRLRQVPIIITTASLALRYASAQLHVDHVRSAYSFGLLLKKRRRKNKKEELEVRQEFALCI